MPWVKEVRDGEQYYMIQPENSFNITELRNRKFADRVETKKIYI